MAATLVANRQISLYTIVSVTSTTYNATHTNGNIVLLVDAATAGGNVTINLPAVASTTATYIIKKIDSGGNTVTVDANSTETIDGATTQVVMFQNTVFTIVTNGSAWYRIV